MSDSTISEDFRDWNRFCARYYETVRCALIGMSYVHSNAVDDLAQSFFTKLIQKDGLDRMPRERSRFRAWLFTSLRNHVIDEFRRSRRQADRAELETGLEPPDERPGPEDHVVEADSLYALSILHLALQRLRYHCESTGRPEVWRIFEDLILVAKLEGREAEAREVLLQRFPGKDGQFLDNKLTTAKRILRRILPEVIPIDLTEHEDHQARFAEWREIITGARLGGGDPPLRAALRVTPVPASELTEYSSIHVARQKQDFSDLVMEDPTGSLSTDELRILLNFRLSMPFRDFLGKSDESAAWAADAKHASEPSKAAAGPLGCLLDAIEPRTLGRELDAATRQRLLTIIVRLKKVAKWTHAKPHHGQPVEISILLYNLANALAIVHCQTRIDTLSDAQLSENLRWSLERVWLDDRLRPLFRNALAQLGHVD